MCSLYRRVFFFLFVFFWFFFAFYGYIDCFFLFFFNPSLLL